MYLFERNESRKIFLGPFTPTFNRSKGVEFSSPIGVMAYYTVIVPLKLQDNLWSIVDPLSYSVWICFLTSIPIYIVAMSFMNYFHSGFFCWESVASLIIRGVLSERRSRSPPKHLYQKILVLIWSWTMLVLISAYKGNLLAIITKPSMNMPFMNVEDMVEQTQMKWGYNSGVLFRRYAMSKPPGTTLRKIYDQATTVSTHPYCHSVLKKLGDKAAVCDISGAMTVMANDFTKTGTCNYYLTKDKILAIDSALAFPVSIGECCYNNLYCNYTSSVSETKPFP